jgi:hypothetical protein
MDPSPGAAPNSPKPTNRSGRFTNEEKEFIKAMEERHEREIACYASSINKSKESVLQQMSTRRRLATSRQTSVYNMQVSLYSDEIKEKGGEVVSHGELLSRVRDAREARDRHPTVGEGDHEAGYNADRGDCTSVLFMNDEEIRVAYEEVQQRLADRCCQTGKVAGVMKDVVKQLSDQVCSASPRLAYPIEYL